MSEYQLVEKPFLNQLKEQDWIIIDQGPSIPQDPFESLRDSFRQWILPQVFKNAVCSINKTSDGVEWLTERQLLDLQDQIIRQPLRTLLEANETVQALLFKAQVDRNELTGEADPVVKLIDFHNPENNQFHAINQFRIDTPGCVKSFITPDIALFINGIPLCVVECKVGGPNCANPMHEAFKQFQRYLGNRKETIQAGLREGEPRLFYSNLLLIRTTGVEADFGTITSGEEHFFQWKTLFPLEDSLMMGMNSQQKLIAGMLTKQNLLQILRTSSVFKDTESGTRIKVVCRYQQFRAANKILKRLRKGKSVLDRSGVIWHTQGSGKSLTMVFLARMIRASYDLQDYKIILVNDRIDLEEQLSKTAVLIGGKVNIIDSTEELRSHLSTDSSDINMAMIHKFYEHDKVLPLKVAEALMTYQSIPSAKTFGVVNGSDKIILMVDEAHRTQSSDLGDNLFEAFPNAARIAFTGTPLITERHGEKKTHRRFGEYIDTYKLMDAVNDGATLQILYEGKTADTALYDKSGFDSKFEDLFKDRTDEELLAIKKKYGATGDILEAEKRIADISKDLVEHYLNNIFPNGFKAQVVVHSKLAAYRYQRAIEAALKGKIQAEENKPDADIEWIKKLNFLKTAVVISSEGTNEPAYVTAVRKQAKKLNAVENFCKPFDFNDLDKENTGIAFLIVCDMLITGFDAPVEQVMYIDKKLKEHALLQAIARTNRVAKGKKRGYIVDYIGLANHLTQALTIYAITDEQQELYDGLKQNTSELPILEERYQRLLQLFKSKNVKDIEKFVQGKFPDIVADAEVVHQAVTILKDEKLRSDFEVFLKKFLISLDIILPHLSAQPYRIPAKRFGYIFSVAKERYKDSSLSLGDAGEKVKALINEHLISLGINPKVPPVELTSEDFINQLNKHSGGNNAAKASEMEHAIRKHCTIHHDEDPAFYENLSEKVEHLIEKYQDQWELLVKELEKIRDDAIQGRTRGYENISKEAAPFYDHVINIIFNRTDIAFDSDLQIKQLMEQIVEILQRSIGSIDFWLNHDKQKRVRSKIKTALILTGIPELRENRERITIEVMKLAKNRHDALLENTK